MRPLTAIQVNGAPSESSSREEKGGEETELLIRKSST